MGYLYLTIHGKRYNYGYIARLEVIKDTVMLWNAQMYKRTIYFVEKAEVHPQ
jgi:hypothetical protein